MRCFGPYARKRSNGTKALGGPTARLTLHKRLTHDSLLQRRAGRDDSFSSCATYSRTLTMLGMKPPSDGLPGLETAIHTKLCGLTASFRAQSHPTSYQSCSISQWSPLRFHEPSPAACLVSRKELVLTYLSPRLVCSLLSPSLSQKCKISANQDRTPLMSKWSSRIPSKWRWTLKGHRAMHTYITT